MVEIFVNLRSFLLTTKSMANLSEMPILALPPAKLRFETGLDGHTRVFDTLRRRFVTLTPEEWVRQHFTAFMIGYRGYPAGLMANEVALRLNTTLRRCDTVVFERLGGTPLMIVEYKAPSVAITQKVFDQIARYNLVLKTRWLVVSNGLNHYCCNIDPTTGRYAFVDGMPAYADIARTRHLQNTSSLKK